MTGRVVAAPAEPKHRCTPGVQPGETAPEQWSIHLGKKHAREYPPGTVWECRCGRQYISAWGMQDPNEPEHVVWLHHHRVRVWCDRHPVALWLLLVAVCLVGAAALTAWGFA